MSTETVPALAADSPQETQLRFRRRLASLVYELLILMGLTLIPAVIGALAFGLSKNHQFLATQLCAFLVYGVYFSWFWSQQGQTLPMQTWRIRLVTDQNKNLSIMHAMVRYIFAYLWIAPAALLAWINHWTGKEFIWTAGVWAIIYIIIAAIHPRHHFLHDIICRTRIIKTNANSFK